MNNLIVITEAKKFFPYLLWSEAEKNPSFVAERSDEPGKQVGWLRFSGENMQAWIFNEAGTSIEKIVNQIKDILQQKSNDGAFFIAAHTGTHKKLAEPGAIKKDDIYLSYLSHTTTDKKFSDLFEAVDNFIKSPGAESFDKVCEQVKKKVELNVVYSLKHRLTKILLPIQIDLQGLKETGYDEDYFEEIVSDYKKNGERLIEDLKKLRNDYSNINGQAFGIISALQEAEDSNFIVKLIQENKIDQLKTDQLKIDNFFDWCDRLQKATDNLAK